MTLTFIQGHSLYEKVEISALLSLQTSEWIWMKFEVVPWPLGLSKLMQSNKQTNKKLDDSYWREKTLTVTQGHRVKPPPPKKKKPNKNTHKKNN